MGIYGDIMGYNGIDRYIHIYILKQLMIIVDSTGIIMIPNRTDKMIQHHRNDTGTALIR